MPIISQATQYTPSSLLGIKDKVAEVAHSGQKPVVMFDLDDTLLDTRQRNLMIFTDFANNDDNQKKYPEETKILQNINIQQIHYLLTDTLAALNISNQDFVNDLNAFWASKFFTNEYCSKDKSIPGAASYLQLLSESGAIIIYLTGRDAPRMGDGTKANLKSLGFPLDGVQSRLIMKPDAKIDDTLFKVSQFDEISKMGVVVGVFENEPTNINLMNKTFPAAIPIFLDTIHSSRPAVVNPDIYWVKNFFIP